MEFVIDSNIIFSTLLRKNSRFREFIFDKGNRIYAPAYLTEEIRNNHNKIIRCSELSENEIDELLTDLYHRIEFIDENSVSKERRQQAYQLCKNIDPTDVPFIALALETNKPLLTGDKILKEGLKQQGFHLFIEMNNENP